MYNQLQSQIENLRRDLNNVVNMVNQLAQSEAQHAQELQRIAVSENNASQQLRHVGQLCSNMSQSLSGTNAGTQQYAGYGVGQYPQTMQGQGVGTYGGVGGYGYQAGQHGNLQQPGSNIGGYMGGQGGMAAQGYAQGGQSQGYTPQMQGGKSVNPGDFIGEQTKKAPVQGKSEQSGYLPNQSS